MVTQHKHQLSLLFGLLYFATLIPLFFFFRGSPWAAQPVRQVGHLSHQPWTAHQNGGRLSCMADIRNQFVSVSNDRRITFENLVLIQAMFD